MSKKIVVGVIIYMMLGLVITANTWPWGEKSKAKGSQEKNLTEVLPKEQSPSTKPPAVSESTKEQQLEQEQNILIANFNALRNQEITVNVLQQLFNRELAELMRMQAVFCDQYGLNPDKWRQGLYEYDATSGKFIEKNK